MLLNCGVVEDSWESLGQQGDQTSQFCCCCCSVAQSCPTLQPHGLQHARPPCPSPTPGVYSNSCPLSQWCHPTKLSSVVPFSSCLQSLPASEYFPVSQFLTSGGQSIGVSASTSVLPMNTHDWSPLGWTGWISLQSKGLLSLLQQHSSKAHILWCPAFFIVQLSHPYMTTGKTIAWLDGPLLAMSCLCFLICCHCWYSFSSKEEVSFNLMVVVTICSDFGAPPPK